MQVVGVTLGEGLYIGCASAASRRTSAAATAVERPGVAERLPDPAALNVQLGPGHDGQIAAHYGSGAPFGSFGRAAVSTYGDDVDRRVAGRHREDLLGA